MVDIEIQNVSVAVLKPINLAIPAGQCVTLMGASGSGKTLLLRAIADLDVHQGEVVLGEQRRSELDAPSWRSQVGLLLAESPWWRKSVGDHFLVKNRGWLHSGLTALGFELEVMDWQVDRLSTGEKQRLALLRLLDRGPNALLLDEPTANLDSQNRDAVEALIHTYRTEANAAVIWVSHDLQQACRVGDRSFKIEDAELVEITQSGE